VPKVSEVRGSMRTPKVLILPLMDRDYLHSCLCTASIWIQKRISNGAGVRIPKSQIDRQ
jgi:hypothetical protein